MSLGNEPFFWRIFFSAWIVVLVTTALTLWAASLLPEQKPELEGGIRTKKLVNLVARELRRQLAIDPTQAADVLARDHLLDFGPLLRIYVLDPSGDDLLGRAVPSAVAVIAAPSGEGGGDSPGPTSPQLQIEYEGLDGYRVVGYEGRFPIGRVLLKPGGRVLLLMIALMVSAGVSFMLARFIVLPVRRLRAAGQKVAAGDLTVRVAHTVGGRSDDIARLAHDFDLMTERIDALLQAQQRLMRDVSHELRSPLARLQALLSIARQRQGDRDTEQIDRMEAELERLDALIGEILAYSRLEAREGISRHPTDIVDLLRNIVDDASVEGQAAGKQIRLQAPARCVSELDSGLIQSAIENVVRNALRYTEAGTAIDVRIADEANRIHIAIDDHGPGVPAEKIAKIFEPFYRADDSRSPRSGSGGIGLAIAARSIRLHGGTISAHNRDGGGLRVEITLPSAR